MKKDNRIGRLPVMPAIRNADIKKPVVKKGKRPAKIPVVINKNTTIYVHDKSDISKVLEKYQYLNERRF